MLCLILLRCDLVDLAKRVWHWLPRNQVKVAGCWTQLCTFVVPAHWLAVDWHLQQQNVWVLFGAWFLGWFSQWVSLYSYLLLMQLPEIDWRFGVFELCHGGAGRLWRCDESQLGQKAPLHDHTVPRDAAALLH